MKVTKLYAVILLGIGCSTFSIPQDTPEYKYFVGYGTHKRTVDEAHRVATEDIFKQVSDYVGIEVQGSFESLTTENGREFYDRLQTKTDKLFLKSHIINQKTEELNGQNLVSVILVAQYPRSELDSEIKRVESLRNERIKLSAAYASRLKQYISDRDFEGINQYLPNLTKNIQTDNDWLDINNSLAAISEHGWVTEKESIDGQILTFSENVRHVYINFGKEKSVIVQPDENKQIAIKPHVSCYVSPFNLSAVPEGLPQETKKIISASSYRIDRKSANFSIEFSSESSEGDNYKFIENDLRSVLDNIGFTRHPKMADYRILFDYQTSKRSDNTNGIISIGAKLSTTVVHIASKKKTTFTSKELVGFGGSFQDAAKNTGDNIQKYLTSDWIEEFNYRVYQAF